MDNRGELNDTYDDDGDGYRDYTKSSELCGILNDLDDAVKAFEEDNNEPE